VIAADLNVRQFEPEDRKFVFSSWFESYRKGGCAPEVAFPTYLDGQGHLIERLIGDRAHTTILVITPTTIPDEICGWACADVSREIVHYTYVKQAYRRLGMARQLVTSLFGSRKPAWFTHETRVGRTLAGKLGVKFNPYLLF
jgi:hypothetical protein